MSNYDSVNDLWDPVCAHFLAVWVAGENKSFEISFCIPFVKFIKRKISGARGYLAQILLQFSIWNPRAFLFMINFTMLKKRKFSSCHCKIWENITKLKMINVCLQIQDIL